MPTEYAFRVSTYLTLAMACVCLGYAEWDFVPEASGFMAAVLALLAVSFRYEGRIELSLARANALGLGIAVFGVAWMAVKLTSPPRGMMVSLPWPTNILPYAGPLLMVLIPAKLFRPKHVGDWWTMQGVGLAAVGLAAAMSDDAAFVALLAAYLFLAVLSLTQFYYRRSGGLVAPLPVPRPAPRPAVVFAQSNVSPDAPPPYRFAAGRSVRWLGYAVLAAGPLFLLTPRSGLPAWGLAAKRMEVGFNPDQTPEMNNVGDLQASREVACDLTVRWPDGRPADLDLIAPSPQYWRGRAFRVYDGGRWGAGGVAAGGLIQPPPADAPRAGRPADAWARAGRTPFVVDVTARGRSIAVALSPVAWVAGADSPVATVTREGRELPWPIQPDGQPAPSTNVGRDRLRQTAVPPPEPGLGPALPRTTSAADYASWVAALTRGAPDGVRRLGEQLLRRWVAAGRLPAAALEDDRPGLCRVAPAYHEAVALAFRDHMVGSGEYTYSTKIRRANKAVDPIEDFLLNVKEGHCQWFAAGYVLLLRGVGVPCQFVLGYRGQEAVGEGQYQILQESAHAWAEVLVARPAGGDALHWLTVDPTTGGEAAGASETRGWWANARHRGLAFVSDYILGYSPDRQQKALAAMRQFGESWWPLVPAAAAVWVLWRTRRRWRPARPRPAPHPLVTSATPPWFLDYLTATARLGLLPPTGQTPKEFAEAVAAALRASPAGAAVAEVPAYLTSKFYRVRYGGGPLTAAEEADVSAAVARLLAAVQDLSVLAPAAAGAVSG